MVIHDQSLPRSTVVPATWADPAPPASPASPSGRWAPLVLWFGCLTTAVILLLRLGGGRLATPAVTEPGAWLAWATTSDPLVVAMGALRVVGLGLAWYLTGVTSISVLARALRAARLVQFADALSFGPVRMLAQQAVGLGLAAGVLATSVPGAPVAARGTDVAHAGAAAVLPVDAADAAADVASAAAPAGLALQEPAPVPVPVPGVTVARVRERQVVPGDHFWAIAASEVADHLGRAGSEAEVLDHWEDLVAANADRLVVQGNPDLLFPGQRILLPEVGA